MRKYDYHHFSKTINNINIVLSNYLQTRYDFAIFTLNDVLVWKVNIKFKEMSFSIDFRTGTFNYD